jgi:hypothetical protein
VKYDVPLTGILEEHATSIDVSVLYLKYIGSTLFKSVGNGLSEYAVSYPRRQKISSGIRHFSISRYYDTGGRILVWGHGIYTVLKQ